MICSLCICSFSWLTETRGLCVITLSPTAWIAFVSAFSQPTCNEDKSVGKGPGRRIKLKLGPFGKLRVRHISYRGNNFDNVPRLKPQGREEGAGRGRPRGRGRLLAQQ